MTPAGDRVEAKAGEPITFEIDADAPGELHVHSTPEHEIEFEPGTSTHEVVDRPAGHRRGRAARPRDHRRPARGPLTGALAPPRQRLERVRRPGPRDRRRQGPADPPRATIAGAVAALAVSFTVLALAWREPRYDAATSGRPAPAWLAALVDSPAFRSAAAAVGLVFFLYVAWVGGLRRGPADQPVLRHVLRAAVGRHRAGVAAARARSGRRSARCARSTRCSPGSPAATPSAGCSRYPARLGYWPAALGLFAFVWLELVYPSSTELGPVRLWCAAYVAAMLVGGAVFGNRFYERADPFEVYSTLVGKLSVWGRRDGALVVRSPLANLDTVGSGPAWSAWCRCCSAAPPSTRSRTPPSGCGSPTSTSSRRTSWTTWPCSASASGSGLILDGGDDAHRGGSGAVPVGAAGPVRALGRADHRRLHHRPLPQLPRRGRPADGDPDERPDVATAATCSAPATGR